MGIYKDVMRVNFVFFEIVIVKNYKHRVAERHFFLRKKPFLGKQNQEIEKREKKRLIA